MRESRQKGDTPADDDLVRYSLLHLSTTEEVTVLGVECVAMMQIRLQLETLLAEKSRLANENDINARENMFLREMVEYHQLTKQDILYLDDRNEEEDDDDSEAYPVHRFLTFSLSHPDSEVPSYVVSRSSSPSASFDTLSHKNLGHDGSTQR